MGDFCRSYVLVLADLASSALGRPVTAVNLARTDDVTSASLLREVQTVPTMREAIGRAAMVTIQVGNNDWQGPCAWDGAAACLERARAEVAGRIGRILEEVVALRGGSPAGVRVVTYADTTWETDDLADAWGFDKDSQTAAFHAMFTQALKALNASTCQVARSHKVVCVDLLPALNGPAGSDAPGLGGIHPDAAGHEKIAAVIARAGFADVR
jgi:lysophospholipase L1-like esterase